MISEAQRLLSLECPKGKIDLVIDSDTYNEIDDQFAIAYAVHAPEKIRLQAIYAAPFFNERSNGPADGMEKSKMVYHIHRDALLADLFGHISG